MTTATLDIARPAAGRWNAAVWAGRSVLALVTLFLLMDIIGKLLVIQPVIDTMGTLGYPIEVAPPLGAIQALCLALFLVPRTRVFGAVLLTAFLGGAVSTHVRIGSPLFSHVLFPVYVGALVWLSAWLRDPRVRTLLAEVQR